MGSETVPFWTAPRACAVSLHRSTAAYLFLLHDVHDDGPPLIPHPPCYDLCRTLLCSDFGTDPGRSDDVANQVVGLDRLRCVLLPCVIRGDSNCVACFSGHDTDPIHIETIEISPDPPLPGQELTVTVTGTAKETIEVCLAS